MKKNISRIAALLAAAALVFGAVGCSSDDGDENTPDSGTPVTVTEVTVDKSSVSLTVGDTASVTATVTPSNATDKTVTWSSSDESVATVDSNGKITAKAAGSATVTVTTTDGKKTAKVAVTVTPKDAGGEGGGDTPVTPASSVTYNASDITADELTAMEISGTGTAKIKKEGTYSIWSKKGAIVTAAGKMSIKIDSTKNTVDSIVSATNMTGSTATAVPAVGAALSTIGGNGLVNYVEVATPASGTNSISLNISTNASTKALETGLSYWILVTDTDGKILAVKDIGDIKTESYTKQDIDLGSVATGDKICIGFARGSGSGGLLIHSVTLTPAE